MNKILFYVNPVSGGVDKKPFLEEAAQKLAESGIEHRVFETEPDQDSEIVMKEIQSYNPDLILAVGGDGTVSQLAQILKGTDHLIGIIPLGSANGLARDLEIDKDPMAALRNLLDCETTYPMDLLEINGEHYMVHIGDAGINANIVNSYNLDENRGFEIYAKYFIEELRKSEPFQVEIQANGEVVKKTGVMLALCNAKRYGIGYPISSLSDPMDGKFEIVVIEKINALSFVKAGLTMIDEELINESNNSIIQTDLAEIRLESPRLFQLDGEVIGEMQNISVKILKGAIKVLLNKSANERPS